MKKIVLFSALTLCMTAAMAKPVHQRYYDPSNNPVNQPAQSQPVDESVKSDHDSYGDRCVYNDTTKWVINEDDTITISLGAWGKGTVRKPESQIMFGEWKVGTDTFSRGSMKEGTNRYEVCKDSE